MNSSYQIFIRTRRPCFETAQELASAMHLTLAEEDNLLLLFQPARPWTGQVGGEISPNIYANDPEDGLLLEGYDMVWTLASTTNDTDQLRLVVEEMFATIVNKLTVPVLLLLDLTWVIEMWDPRVGGRRFPAGTTPDQVDELA
jgi:hypothetical protein